MQQLEFDFDTPLEKAIKHAFKIGFVRGTKSPGILVEEIVESELQHFLKQVRK